MENCYCGANHDMSFEEAVDVLAATPDRITSLIEQSRGELDESSPLHEAVAGIAEAEIVVAMHIRLMLAEAVPDLPPFDEGRWASELDYETRDAEVEARAFRVLRSGNVGILREVESSRRAREGWHPEFGTITLEAMVVHTASRDETVLKRIDAVIDALRASLARSAVTK